MINWSNGSYLCLNRRTHVRSSRKRTKMNETNEVSSDVQSRIIHAAPLVENNVRHFQPLRSRYPHVLCGSVLFSIASFLQCSIKLLENSWHLFQNDTHMIIQNKGCHITSPVIYYSRWCFGLSRTVSCTILLHCVISLISVSSTTVLFNKMIKIDLKLYLQLIKQEVIKFNCF